MTTIFALLAAAALSGPAPQQLPSAEVPEARIPFANFHSIHTFHPVSEDEVYLQDIRRNWYLATLNGPCFNIMSAIRIGVDTRFGDTVDNTSSFIVDGEHCPIQSLVRSGPPPSRRHHPN